ncbi:MAG: OsmC family peroxiredoxin, partial [Gammaproteobacteria bacterium]|nr:OsmC family peroxiredoxin [Gammaproteobacteria bacterium]
MNAHAENQRTASTLNGIDVDQIEYVIGEVKNDRAFGQCQFRAKNKWVDGGINRSEIQDYFIGG